MSQKRERSINFTREEVEILIKLVECNKHILENKKSDVVTWGQKEECWKAIELSFNAASGSTLRTSKNLRLKYEGIKRDSRKKSALLRAEIYRTGGGSSTAPVLTPSESKVKDIILLSVDGMERNFDSDSLPNTIPTNVNGWKEKARNYEVLWNFPHCIGAIDGKHVLLEAPPNSGSDYYNYKENFSLVLLAVVDAEYNFVYVNCGAKGKLSDSGVFQETSFYKALNEQQLNLPNPEPLIQGGPSVPYSFVLVGDSAFALSENMMKPYPGIHEKGSLKRIFNYRLSRARRVVENVFGLMSVVFRVFRKPKR